MPGNGTPSWGQIAQPCAHCGAQFWEFPSHSGRKYCSNTCRLAAISRPKIERVCQLCGARFWVYPSSLKYGPRIFCSLACMHQGRRMNGPDHPNWKGGKRLSRGGYVRVWVGPNLRRLEHQVVWEEAHGQKVPPGHQVHHLDGNPTNNRAENLVALPLGAHQRLHGAQNRQRWAPQAGWLCCQRCGTTTRKHLARGYCGACYQRLAPFTA